MEHRQLGNSGLYVSRLALGTMTWGLNTDVEAAAGQLVAFRDAGGTLVDTADVYQHGHSEEILGILDVSFYRDDFTRSGLHPQVRPSELPFEIDGQHLVLVDDVLMSGRTIRAALNELFDYGRPASVTLVCLLDLNARELPIRPDVVGQTLSLAPNERVKLRGPAPLVLERTLISAL